MKKILDVPHIVQYYDLDSKRWQGKSCGIVSLAMVLNFFGIEKSPDELVKEALKKDGYIKNVGWKHQIICDLASKYGLESSRTENDNIENLMESLDKGNPVIISIYKNWKPENGGHLAVLNGFFISEGNLEGFYVNDPVGASFKHKDQFIPIEKFENGWKKRAIYIREPALKDNTV